MKKIYIFLLMILSVFANAQVINFTDANFKAKLLQANTSNNIALNTSENPIVVDTNANGEIELSEALNVEVLNLDNSAIADLTGISSFTNLRWLRCNYNQLTEITIDPSVTILALSANHNQISSVSVNFGNQIEGIDLSYNNLTSFTFSGRTVWETFNLSHNQLTSLSLSNANFDYFNISSNNLSEIQFAGSIWFFRHADFRNNEFSFLDLSTTFFDYDNCNVALGNNIQDIVLFPEMNPPSNISYSSTNTFFDLGNFRGTDSCDPEDTGNLTITSSPNLQEVIFKNGFNHSYITCNEGGNIFQKPALNLMISNCPSLNHLCVDSGSELAFMQTRIAQLGLQNQVTIDSNCTSSALEIGSEVLEPFTVFPVPVGNVLYLQSNGNVPIRSIEIYNTLGQLVQKETGNRQSIDVSRLAKGSYYLEIKTDDLIDVKRFVKE